MPNHATFLRNTVFLRQKFAILQYVGFKIQFFVAVRNLQPNNTEIPLK